MRPAAPFAAVTTVTFDAAGTLLRPHPSVGAVYGEVARRHGRDFDPAALERAFHAALGCVSKSSTQRDPELREQDFWRRVVDTTLRACGPLPANFEACFAELWDVFARGDSWRLLTGARSTLQTLRARGYRLAVLSNWDRRLHRVLAETRLQAWFDRVLISSEVGAEKPDVAIFRAAERALEAVPGQCLHVGDSRPHDLDGARGAGWNALLVRSDAAAPSSDHVIPQLADLLPLLPGRQAG